MTAYLAIELAPRRTALWFAATVLVAAAHGGAAYVGLSRWPDVVPDSEPQGAISIELAPLVADASAPEAEIARAEETTNAVVPQQPQETEPDAAPHEVPVAAPSPVTDPELVVPMRLPLPVKDSKKEGERADAKEERKPDTNTAAQANNAPATPPEAGAPAASTSASQAQAQSPAPSSKLGKTRKPSPAQVSWQKSLLLKLDRNKRYPAAARRQQLAGVVTVGFVIDRQGRVLSSRIAKSSGFPVLDAEAVGVLSRSSPLPAPPADIGGDTLSLSMPIQFRVQN